MGNLGSPFIWIIKMKEPTYDDLCGMILKSDATYFWDYINEVLINNNLIRIVPSHLHKTLSLGSSNMSYYVGVFKPKGNERIHSAPLMYFLEDEHILLNDCGSSSAEFITERYELQDTGTEFNFNMMNPEIGISFSELKVLLEFAQRIKCSFFMSTERK